MVVLFLKKKTFIFKKKMPALLSTILYISNYKKSTFLNFFISFATDITRLDENDLIQTFNLTVFYPIDSLIPCYV